MTSSLILENRCISRSVEQKAEKETRQRVVEVIAATCAGGIGLTGSGAEVAGLEE